MIMGSQPQINLAQPKDEQKKFFLRKIAAILIQGSAARKEGQNLWRQKWPCTHPESTFWKPNTQFPQCRRSGRLHFMLWFTDLYYRYSFTLICWSLYECYIGFVEHHQAIMPVQNEMPPPAGYGLGNAICAVCQESFGVDERMVNSNGQILHERCFV